MSYFLGLVVINLHVPIYVFWACCEEFLLRCSFLFIGSRLDFSAHLSPTIFVYLSLQLLVSEIQKGLKDVSRFMPLLDRVHWFYLISDYLLWSFQRGPYHFFIFIFFWGLIFYCLIVFSALYVRFLFVIYKESTHFTVVWSLNPPV
jgi:hypothetical protein